MKLSESFARSIIDAVQSECTIGEVQALLNEFLRAKVTEINKYEPELVQDCPENDFATAGMEERKNGEYIRIYDLLADN
jgi:hypothetical protein